MESLNSTKECFYCTRWYIGKNPVYARLLAQSLESHRRPDHLCVPCLKASQVTQCVFDAYVAYGYKIRDVAWEQIFLESKTQWEDGTALQVIKYRGAALFSWFNQQPMPKCPPSIIKEGKERFHFPGLYPVDLHIRKQFRKARSESEQDRLLGFTKTLLDLKKGMPRADEAALAQESWSTFADLTSRRKDSAFQRHYRHLIKFRLDALIERCFPVQPWTDLVIPVPSRNGHYESGRRSYGAQTSVLRQITGHGGFFHHEPCEALNLERVTWDEECRQPESSVFIDSTTSINRDSLTRHMIDVARQQEPFAQLHSLPEPAKIRTISKGRSAHYSVLHGVRKLLFRGVKSLPNVICDRPMTSCDLTRFIPQLKGGELHVSGDYKAATNNLRAELSEWVMNRIADRLNMPDEIRQLCLQGLTRHEVEFFEVKTQYDLPCYCSRTQREGQLMGSPLSFPILCLINFAVISCAKIMRRLENKRRVPEIRSELTFAPLERDLIVNGDDCAFNGDDRLRELWREFSSAAGLELSVGKTYFHDQWVMINSMIFRRRDGQQFPCTGGDDHCCVYQLIPSLNLGLMYGLKRAGEFIDPFAHDFDPEKDATIGERCEWLLYQLPKDVRAYAYDVFIGMHRPILCTGLPWYLPKELGGTGLPCDDRHQPERRDLLFGCAIKRYPLFFRRYLQHVQQLSWKKGKSLFQSIDRWCETLGLPEVQNGEVPNLSDRLYWQSSLIGTIDDALEMEESPCEYKARVKLHYEERVVNAQKAAATLLSMSGEISQTFPELNGLSNADLAWEVFNGKNPTFGWDVIVYDRTH